MRYEEINNTVFTDAIRGDITIKENRPLKEFEETVKIPYEQGSDLDEIISRPEFEGDNGEDLTYSLIDANKVQMMETNFDLSKFQEIIIPVSNDI
jgi:hypothetical protein